KGQRNILSGEYLLFHQLTFLRRKQGAHVLGVRPFLQSFFNFGPFGVSSMAQPLVFSSSRMASARLKSFDFFAAVRASARARISGGTSVSVFAPTPRTVSIFSQAANAAAASAGFREFSAMRRLVSR